MTKLPKCGINQQSRIASFPVYYIVFVHPDGGDLKLKFKSQALYTVGQKVSCCSTETAGFFLIHSVVVVNNLVISIQHCNCVNAMPSSGH